MSSEFSVRAIGVVRCERTEAIDDDWGAVVSTIELDADRFDGEVVAGLDDFSHVEVVFCFDRVDESKINLGSRHPRGNPDWPRVGIFAQRAKARPNRIGMTTCELIEVDGLSLRVQGLDAIDGTPVLDIKPFMVEFAPRGPTRQPSWSSELMAGYWVTGGARQT
jgi:tRNA-Thr(GGU) m(6)t(6)A37 methyltransferase TsaA